MTDGNQIFIDTNILIYAKLSQSPFHQQAAGQLKTLFDQDVDLWISRQVLREYLTAMTRQNLLTEPISVASLVKDVQNFGQTFHIAEDNQQVTENLLKLVQSVSVGGSQIHDANIVATMQAFNIQTLLTHNVKDFERFSNQITVLPLANNLEKTQSG